MSDFRIGRRFKRTAHHLAASDRLNVRIRRGPKDKAFLRATLRRRPFAMVAVGLLATAVMIGCDDSGPMASLRAMSEATLAYPGSISVKEVATPRIDSPDGQSGATYGHLYGANASVDQIVQWFDAELQSRGWRQMDQVRPTNSLSVAAWTNDRAWFRLAVNRPDQMTPDIQAKLVGYSIEYDARVRQIDPAPSG